VQDKVGVRVQVAAVVEKEEWAEERWDPVAIACAPSVEQGPHTKGVYHVTSRCAQNAEFPW
jgi:hypothetical protein